VNPRLGGPAEDLTSEYEENARFIKLQLDAGEIGVVVSAPLTGPTSTSSITTGGQSAPKRRQRSLLRRYGIAAMKQRQAAYAILRRGQFGRRALTLRFRMWSDTWRHIASNPPSAKLT
jgi:hypothetical protein